MLERIRAYDEKNRRGPKSRRSTVPTTTAWWGSVADSNTTVVAASPLTGMADVIDDLTAKEKFEEAVLSPKQSNVEAKRNHDDEEEENVEAAAEGGKNSFLTGFTNHLFTYTNHPSTPSSYTRLFNLHLPFFARLSSHPTLTHIPLYGLENLDTHSKDK